MNEGLKESAKGILLLVLGIGFTIIFIKIAVYGYHYASEDNPYILTMELLMCALAIVLGLDSLIRVVNSWGKRLGKRWKGSSSGVS